LPTLYLSQEIGLVLYRIRTRDEPFIAVFIRFGLRIMTCGDEVVVVAHLLIEGTKLDEPVAHHIRVRGESSLHLIHGVASHLVPVFLMAVNYLQLAAILACHGSSHLQVLLRRAVPFLLFFRSYLDIEAVRVQAQSGKLPYHYRTIHAARKQHGHSLVLYLGKEELVSGLQFLLSWSIRYHLIVIIHCLFAIIQF
jgi:hypothetical protein